MTHAPGNGIEDLYRTVIADVISQCKEAFIDENVDVEILEQIKKHWEEKVNESGAVDLNSKPQTMPTARLPQKPVVQPGKPGLPNLGLLQDGGASASDPNMVQYVANSDYLNSSVNLLSQMQYNQSTIPQFVLSNGQPLPPNVMMVPVSIDTTGNVVFTPEQLKNSGFLSQVDGNADFDGFDFKSKPDDYKVNLDLNKGELVIKKKKNPMKKLVKKFEKLSSENDQKETTTDFIPQVDGGPEMSSSEDEDEEDEEGPITRLVAEIEDKVEEDEDGGDEEPLNSDDDQSDDEDLDTLFDSRNIIVCQFEKVNRARTKWKFTLKDGIMHLDGKDYCFQKCTGEAEW